MTIVLSKHLFGMIALHNAPSRIEGNDLILRSRIIKYDGDGNVESDETHDGCRVENGAHYGYLFP